MEEKKTYSVIGTVTIGTDEYRDLIEQVKDATVLAEKERSDWSREYRRANELEAKNKELENRVKQYEEFIKQDTVKDKYALFLVSMQKLDD